MPILIAILIIIAVLVIIIASRPSDFHVTRSATIDASPGEVFAKVNDLHEWEAWSPWARIDPNAKMTYEGPAAGVGASFSWTGNMKVGQGKMTITESQPEQRIAFRLDFLKPMKGTNTAEFTFAPQENRTLVSWSMAGRNNFIAKAFGLFVSCDKMIGGQFEQGLLNLKGVVEATSGSNRSLSRQPHLAASGS